MTGEINNSGKESIMRSAILFVNFFLIITALYQLKPASRSLILDVMKANELPYVWIGSALTLFIFIAVYHQLLKHFRRENIVLATALLFTTMLIAFRFIFDVAGTFSATALYIFVDIFGVVMVEQFWSLANSIYSSRDGKKWYGIVGTGGLLGGVAGSSIAALLIQFTPVTTPDLLLVAAGIVAIIALLTVLMRRMGLYQVSAVPGSSLLKTNHRNMFSLFKNNHYLMLIAAALLMAQLISPIVDFLFMQTVEKNYPDRESRTAILSIFFSVLSTFSIVVNLIITPILLNVFGILSGLLVQPFVIAVTTFGFGLYPGFISATIMKISDRGLSYSLTRATKELLYIPVETVLMYQAKAWIDMFGYRTFKMLGAVFILLILRWSPVDQEYLSLNSVVILACGLWMTILFILHKHYLHKIYSSNHETKPATSVGRI